MIPALGSINLPKQLTERRKPVYSVGYWFIIKGYNSGTGRWKGCRGQGMGKKHGASMRSPSKLLPLNLHVFTNPETL